MNLSFAGNVMQPLILVDIVNQSCFRNDTSALLSFSFLVFAILQTTSCCLRKEYTSVLGECCPMCGRGMAYSCVLSTQSKVVFFRLTHSVEDTGCVVKI